MSNLSTILDNDALRKDPSIQKWISNYLEEYCEHRVIIFSDFYRFLQSDERFRGKTPTQLVEQQRENGQNGHEYVVLDALQDYIKAKSGTYSSLKTRYSQIRSFFKKNRAPLPDDDFRINPDRMPFSSERLTIDVIRTLVKNAGAGGAAFYLTLWMGLLDLERFQFFNRNYGQALTNHLKERGAEAPFVFEYPGRKSLQGRKKFYTFIGRDALTAWQEYFERVRGFPNRDEAIYLDKSGKPISKNAVRQAHLRLLEKLHYVKRGGEKSNRYGYNLHEFRDVARTLLHLQGKKDGLDSDCVEFWMGHVTDPNKYDKFYLDKNYVLEHYRIAEKYLSIISGGPQASQFSNVDEMIDQIILNKPAFEKLLDSLAKKMGSRLAPI